MAASQTFNIVNASLVNDNSSGAVVQSLVLLITPQPQTVNGQSVPSSYVTQYVIGSPTAAQIAAYTPTSSTIVPTITLTSNV